MGQVAENYVITKKEFTKYISKKQLATAKVIAKDQMDYLVQIRHVFTLELHRERQYVALTLYTAKEKRYTFQVVDLVERTTMDAHSIKEAKQLIRERLKEDARQYKERMEGVQLNLFGETDRQSANEEPSVEIPRPSRALVDSYLLEWDKTPGYYQPDEALRVLFSCTYPCNQSIDDIIIKVSALNSIYHTRIINTYPIAERILAVKDIDRKLQEGAEDLVGEIMHVTYSSGREIDHYSFATKYCCFHNPEAYPIFDSFVGRALWFYRQKENFYPFMRKELAEYPKFKNIIRKFQEHFGLGMYSPRDFDKFFWQYAQKYFPDKYSNKKK